MFKFTAIIAAAATIAIAAPSIAAEKQYDAKIIQRDGETQYCVTQAAPTGSNVPQRICMTQEEWAATGAKVLPKNSTEQLAANPQPNNQN